MSAVPVFAPMLSVDAVAALARRAGGLVSRIAETRDPRRSIADSEVLASRLQLWRAEAAGGRSDLFSKRLAWDEIPGDSARALLVDEWPPDPADSRNWIHFLERLSDAAGSSPRVGTVDGTCDRAAAPFAGAYRPFVAAALRSLGAGPGVPSHHIDPAVLPAMAGGLLKELAKLGGPVLTGAFADFLQSRGASADPASTVHHDAFVADLNSNGGWARVLSVFPALGRLLATVCVGWAAESRDFLARLDDDWDLLRATFFPSLDPGTPFDLRKVQSNLSDRHGGAGLVRVLEFSTGHRLVYKRRPLQLEADFHDLLQTLAAAGWDGAPPALRVLPRSGYGWVEHADAAPVEDVRALTQWFHKAGALLCLMHLLGGNDGHMENIIATARGPILIDLETLLQPRLSQSDQTSAGTFALAARQIHDSVLHTGLLPLWQRGRQGGLYDIGGFTAAGGYESPVLRLTWENLGSDAVRSTWKRGIARGLANLPSLDGTRHSAAGHLPALCAGFSDTWRFLQSHRDLFTGTLSRWKAAPVRVLLRPTTHYAALLERSLGVQTLKLGIDRSLTFEALRRPFLRNHSEKPPFWPAVDDEIRALEDGDIPIFFARAGGHDLEAADGRCLVPNAFGQSALAVTLARLDDLTEASCLRQLDMIAAAFIEPVSASAAPPADPVREPADYDALLASTRPADDQEFIHTATVLGHEIIKAAIRGPDGFVTWLAPAFLQPDRREQRGVSYYLYDGAAGIALFLAALAKVTGLEVARQTALAALDPVRAILDSANAPAMIQREGIGGCSGLGSIVYSLTAISRLLDAPELLERAERVSQLIDSQRIARDQALDIVSGSAGAILALVAFHRATGNDHALGRAAACGRHLLDKAERVGDDALAWPSWPDRLLLAGYSHGTAGQSAALMALFKATGDPAFAEAARAAVRYERMLFDVGAGNWPILLPGGTTRIASTWCHGAPGILLSRLGLLGHFGPAEDALLREEITVAGRATLGAGLSSVDHLCCGTMGRVEILHLAAGELDGRTLDLARLGATLTIRRARERKGFALQADPVCNSVLQPGFFRGISGIGHALLRLARPKLIPSVLNWDS